MAWKKWALGEKRNTTCRCCGRAGILSLTKLIKRKDAGSYRKVWNDETGRIWNGNQCGSCFAKAYSNRPDDVQEPRWKKGMAAERRVAKILSDLGVEFKRTEMCGPDFTIKFKNIILTAEVKSVRKRVNKDGTVHYSFSGITEKRKSDDLLICVFKNKAVVTTMRKRLKSKSPRNVTEFFK